MIAVTVALPFLLTGFPCKTAFLHPDKTIIEELADGEEVTVVLKNKMCVKAGKTQSGKTHAG